MVTLSYGLMFKPWVSTWGFFDRPRKKIFYSLLVYMESISVLRSIKLKYEKQRQNNTDATG